MFEEAESLEFDVFTDLLFNSLVAFAFMFFIAFSMINPVAESGQIDTEVELLITMGWPDDHPDDVDIYVEDPAGNIVWYNQPEGGLMHLDRDDRGQFKDIILINGEEVNNPLNQEIVSVRGLMDGEYIINVVHFIATSIEPLTVTVKVEKMNPSVRVVYYGDLTLSGSGDERTAIRFTLREDEVVDINDREKSLVVLTRSNQPNIPTGGLAADTGEAVNK